MDHKRRVGKPRLCPSRGEEGVEDEWKKRHKGNTMRMREREVKDGAPSFLPMGWGWTGVSIFQQEVC